MRIGKAVIAAAVSAALIGLYTLGYVNGMSHVQAKWDKQLTTEIESDHAVLLLGMKDSYDTGVIHEEQKQEIKYVVETITQKIPVYITDTSSCERLPVGFAELRNLAAEAVNDGIATGKFDGPSWAITPDPE